MSGLLGLPAIGMIRRTAGIAGAGWFDGTGRLPRITHVSMEFDSHLALVRAGLGIALIPRLGRAPLGGDLVAVPVADPVPSREIIALHRASMSDSPAIEALLAALAQRG